MKTVPRRLVPFLVAFSIGCGGSAPHPASPRAATLPAPATPPPASSAPSSPPSSRANDLAAKIDPIFARFGRTESPSPGCAVGVYRAGDVVFARGYGYADLEHGARNTDATPFYLASVSKQFTAASVLLLVQDGKIALADEVRKYVPELPDYGKRVTVEELLHHTSGVRDYGLLLALQGVEDSTRTTGEEILWLLSRQRALNFAPGTRYEYSNSGYVLLSLIVQRVSGKSLGAFEKERIFDPLGMSDTLVKEDHGRIIPGRAMGYERRPDATFGTSMSDTEYTGPGNVVSSVRDLAKWDGNFYAPRVGGQALVDSMRIRGVLLDGSRISYAMGLEEEEVHGIPREAHNGGFVGYRTTIVRYPTERLTVTVLCNDASVDPGELEEQVATIVVHSLAEPQPAKGGGAPARATATFVDPASVAGTYMNEATSDVRVVEWTGGVLRMRMSPTATVARDLVPVGPRELLVKGGTTRYAVESTKGTSAPRLLRKPAEGPAEPYVRVEPVGTIDAATLAGFAGRYGSDELARDVEIVAKDGKLFPRSWGGSFRMEPLVPVAKDVFSLEGEVGCRFERDTRGKVVAVVMTTSRTLGVRLTRR